jgi:endonuclease/exonuclease/phosphatase family metal-dependent hydrolase
MIIGDFNIRLGKITKDAKTSPHSHLQPFATNLDAANLHIILPTHNPTWTFISHNGRSVIDYAAVSDSLTHRTSALQVITDSSIDSPHRPIWIEIKISNQPQHHLPNPPNGTPSDSRMKNT